MSGPGVYTVRSPGRMVHAARAGSSLTRSVCGAVKGVAVLGQLGDVECSRCRTALEERLAAVSARTRVDVAPQTTHVVSAWYLVRSRGGDYWYGKVAE